MRAHVATSHIGNTVSAAVTALTGQAVGLVREGEDSCELQHSDERGHVTITPDTAGLYMVYATHLRPINAEGFSWDSDFVTLTFSVSSR